MIRDALSDLPHDHVPTSRDWGRFSATWREMLEERIDSLMQLRNQITSCIGCGCLSLRDCPLRNPGDRLAELGPGPRRLMARR